MHRLGIPTARFVRAEPSRTPFALSDSSTILS